MEEKMVSSGVRFLFLKIRRKPLFGHPFYFRGNRKAWINVCCNIKGHLMKVLQRVFRAWVIPSSALINYEFPSFFIGIRQHWSYLVFPVMIIICCLTGTMRIAWASLGRKGSWKGVGYAHPHSALLLCLQIQPKSDHVQEPERDAAQNYLEDRTENAIAVAAMVNTLT